MIPDHSRTASSIPFVRSKKRFTNTDPNSSLTSHPDVAQMTCENSGTTPPNRSQKRFPHSHAIPMPQICYRPGKPSSTNSSTHRQHSAPPTTTPATSPAQIQKRQRFSNSPKLAMTGPNAAWYNTRHRSARTIHAVASLAFSHHRLRDTTRVLHQNCTQRQPKPSSSASMPITSSIIFSQSIYA